MRPYLIRHALTLPSGPDSHLWTLSTEGESQADALAAADFWSRIDAIYSSPEEKALATVRPASERHGFEIHEDDRLCEAQRPAVWHEDYEEVVRRYLRNPEDPPEGWEDPREVARRVTGCLDDLRQDRPRDGVAVCGHGLMFTLFLAASNPGRDIFDVWRGIGFCSVAVLDGDEITVPFKDPADVR